VNVLLVSPECAETFWSYRHALKFIGKRAVMPPLGLLTVAAMLPQGWNMRLADLNVSGKLKARDLKWADYAFISAMTVQREASRRVIRRCGENGVKVVAGGPLFTHEYEFFEDVDHFVLNEAEVTLPLFLADLERGSPQRIYTTTEFPDLSLTPVPLYELIDLSRYASASLQYSRGCPFNCDFCNITSLFGRRCRIKSVEQVLAELDRLYEVGWRGRVFFVDDNFIGNKRSLKEDLLPALIEWRKTHQDLTFNTEVSINLADDAELMGMMVKAGFNSVFVGIETPDEKSLAECCKQQNQNRDMVADVKRMHRAGIQVQGGFIVGFDSDEPDIFSRQIDFIQKSNIVTAMVGLLQAIPGTPLYERLEKEGRLRGRSSGDNVDGTTNIMTRMNPEELRRGYQSILTTIYTPKCYYERLRAFLSEFQLHGLKQRSGFNDFLAFLRTIVKLGIIGRERFLYWKLLGWTCFKRPELFSLAVLLAIHGYHFRKSCDRCLTAPDPT